MCTRLGDIHIHKEAGVGHVIFLENLLSESLDVLFIRKGVLRVNNFFAIGIRTNSPLYHTAWFSAGCRKRHRQ